jgi:hypothetical protein
MSAVVVALLAATLLLAAPSRVQSAPPDDVAAFCRASHPDPQLQLQCLAQEAAAADRIARALVAQERLNQCRAASPSWSAFERCLAAPAGEATPPSSGGAGGAPAEGTPGPGPVAEPAVPAGAAAAPGPAAAETPAPPALPALDPPSSSTLVLGPRAVPFPPTELQRRTRMISEADADRHLRRVLERVGRLTADCTKKQYGPGWVIICD